MQPDGILTADVGQNQIWTARNFSLTHGRFLTSGGMGTMGYSVPAACGAALAAPGRPVAAVCGDGAFQMQMMELATLRSNRLPVKIVVMNNGRLGMVRELQDQHYAGNETAVFLDGSPDFVRLAEAYGIPALRVSDDGALADAMRRMWENDSPFLLECLVAPDEPSL